MKKNLFLVVFAIGFSVAAHAQFTVWEDDFNDGNATDWTLLDVDGNGSNWAATGNLQMSDAGAIFFGTDYAVLSTYNVNLQDGSPLPTGEDNWAISPAIDLSLFSGATQLIINAQPAIYGSDYELTVYASTTPEPESFQLISTVTLLRPNGSTDLQFNDYSIDISQFVGEEHLYIAFKPMPGAGGFVGYEINNVSITAAEIAGLNDVAKTTTILKQNPVANNLELQLGTAVHAESLNVKIYNISGILIKEAVYQEAGINVSELSSGVYLMVLNDGVATEHLKFIKK